MIAMAGKNIDESCGSILILQTSFLINLALIQLSILKASSIAINLNIILWRGLNWINFFVCFAGSFYLSFFERFVGWLDDRERRTRGEGIKKKHK